MNSLAYSALWHLRRMPERAVEVGLPPSVLGWKWRRRVSLDDYLAEGQEGERKERLESAGVQTNPLPRNISERSELSRDGDLWGYSQYDVPERKGSETYIAHLRDVRFLFYHTPDKQDFFPALISRDDEAIECREISHRKYHSRQAQNGDPQVFDKAAWFLERAYHNHSHWLTAHLPKLLILKDRHDLGPILLPENPTPVMLESIRMLGMEPDRFRRFDPARPVEVRDLALVGTDRFGPTHANAVRDAFSTDHSPADRKLFISRANSRGRKLVNEEALWSELEKRGFERVLMESLSFREQVQLLQQCRILLAPHGAGLTNMIFMPEGGHIVEMADPGFPNPNFYALSCALGLDYWLLHADATDESNPLDRDLTIDPDAVCEVLDRID